MSHEPKEVNYMGILGNSVLPGILNRRKETTMWTLRVIDEHNTVWDETSYGGNSCNTLETLKSDLQYIIEHPECIEYDRRITLTFTK